MIIKMPKKKKKGRNRQREKGELVKGKADVRRWKEEEVGSDRRMTSW